jgi:chitinase
VTAPGSGASYYAPAAIALAAAASDGDGSITQAQFYANGALLETDTAAPYGFTWANEDLPRL